MLQFQIENNLQMYSPASTQGFAKPKSKANEDTGLQFAKQESFSFEVQAEREYVHRLKAQREKIEALYSKYDSLLEEMRKKDDKIKEQERRIGDLTIKCKEYSFLMSELDLLRKENSELLADNESIRFNLAGIQQSYMLALNDCKSKSSLNERQREKVEDFNGQLLSKLRMLQQKMEDRYCVYEKDKKDWCEKVDEVQKEMHLMKTRHIDEIAVMNTEILRREEEIDIIHKENQRLREAVIHWEQSSICTAQQNEQKVEKIHSDYKIKIRSIRQEIDQHIYNNQLLTNRITALNLQIQKITQENTSLRDTIADQKRRCEQIQYESKVAFNQQKSIMREHTMQLESRIAKLDKQLNDSLRREKEMVANLKRVEQNEQVKKSLRQVERRQLQKINRLLLLQK